MLGRTEIPLIILISDSKDTKISAKEEGNEDIF